MKQPAEPPTSELDEGRRAVVARLFPEAGYGFLTAADCREVLFKRDSVLRDEFDELRIGSEVRYDEVEGDDGPAASLVDLISTPLPDGEESEEVIGDEDEVPEMPSPFEDDEE